MPPSSRTTMRLEAARDGVQIMGMAKISQPAILMLTEGGKVYLEKHGLESDPVVATIPKQYMSPYGVGNNVYTTVLAYRTDAFKGRRAPASWADFWNVKDIPGRRGLRKHPFDTIEEALMADGVATDKVYPCDIDRALASLDKIKPSAIRASSMVSNGCLRRPRRPGMSFTFQKSAHDSGARRPLNASVR